MKKILLVFFLFAGCGPKPNPCRLPSKVDTFEILTGHSRSLSNAISGQTHDQCRARFIDDTCGDIPCTVQNYPLTALDSIDDFTPVNYFSAGGTKYGGWLYNDSLGHDSILVQAPYGILVGTEYTVGHHGRLHPSYLDTMWPIIHQNQFIYPYSPREELNTIGVNGNIIELEWWPIDFETENEILNLPMLGSSYNWAVGDDSYNQVRVRFVRN